MITIFYDNNPHQIKKEFADLKGIKANYIAKSESEIINLILENAEHTISRVILLNDSIECKLN